MTAVAERKARLDQETVLLAAETLVDDLGIDAITMTLLATELGTTASTLYNHVASLDDLRSELQIRAMRTLGDNIRRAAMGASGEDGLNKLAGAFLVFIRSHPRRYDIMTRPIHDRRRFFEASSGAVEGVAAVIGSAGIADEQQLPALMAFFSALHGFGSLETSGFFDPVDNLGVNLDDVYAEVIRGAVWAMLNKG